MDTPGLLFGSGSAGLGSQVRLKASLIEKGRNQQALGAEVGACSQSPTATTLRIRPP